VSYPGALGIVDQALRHLRQSYEAFVAAMLAQHVSATVYRASDQGGIASGAVTPIVWTHQAHNEGGCWNAAVPSRLTAPASGVYLLAASWIMKDHATDGARVSLMFRKNGDTYVGGAQDAFPHAAGVSGGSAAVSHVYVAQMAAEDYFEALAFHNEGSNRTLWGGSLYNFGAIARVY